MPNIKSAIKRVKVSNKKGLQNKVQKSNLKTSVKKLYESLEANSDNSLELLNVAIKKVDKAAATSIIHKNAANRKKSQMMKAYNKANA